MVDVRSLSLVLLTVVALWSAGPALPAQEQGDDYAGMVRDGQRKAQRGELRSAEALFQEVLDAFAEEPEPSRPGLAAVADAQLGLWGLALRRGDYESVRDGIAAADPALRGSRAAQLLAAEVAARLGDYVGAAARCEQLVTVDPADREARHQLGEMLWRDGQRQRARDTWRANVAGTVPSEPLQATFYARSLWRLGGAQNFADASQALVAAMAAAPDLAEPRITYGLLKFEAYGEASNLPSGERDLKQVLTAHIDLEEALLAMYRIRSGNGVLDPSRTEQFLERALQRNPRCVPALVQRAVNVLDDRRYGDAARLLDEALAIDPNDRITLCHRAAAAWLQHDADAYAAFRARAEQGDAGWPMPDRLLADHLTALYRFADALPFYAAANQLAPDDVPSLQGLAKVLVYTGEGHKAKEVLLRAKDAAAGLNDPWRNNALAIQELLDEQYTVVENDHFVVQMHRDDAEVLATYLLPIQLEAFETLGAKYSFAPDHKVKVEVLHTWDDFSVRTIGFRGFTALGACFGGLITMVSPRDGDLRKNDFMWEATAWHEYAHVLTLGLSNNRVPRWLTEGFSVYEEKARDPSWERGMDRDLFDAFHNRDIPPIHLLNRLFRGDRILFGYYQGGLIVDMIARRYGFAKALDLLRAFGDDLDTEAAFRRVFGMTSQAFDQEFLQFVETEKLRGMRLVARVDDTSLLRLEARAAQDATNLQVRTDLAWACLQRDNPVDAGRWLAEVLRVEPGHAQANLARARLLWQRKDVANALACWERGFAGGADDFDSRIACGDAKLADGDTAGAIEQWQRAKKCWPGCTEQATAPELRLAKLYREQGDLTQAQMEMKAFCRRTARAFAPRWQLAEAARDAGTREEEVRLLVECNRIDPFMRELHERLGEAYVALAKQAAAAREFEMAAAVLPALDRRNSAPGVEPPGVDSPAERAARGELWLRAARLRHELGDRPVAERLLARVLRDAGGTPAAANAKSLQQEWAGR